MEIIDYTLIYGAFSMNRESNRINDVKDFTWGLPPCNKMLMPGFGNHGAFKELRVHLQLMVKVETNLSLAIRDLHNQERFPPAAVDSTDFESEVPKEVHFLKMEGLLGTADVSASMFNYRQLSKYVDTDASVPVSDWTIVDFDDFLKGNPHVSSV